MSTENQDYVLHSETDGIEMIILADGVSSCSRSRKGAEISCKTVEKILTRYGLQIFQWDKKEVAEFVLSCVTDELECEQKTENCKITDFSSTLCFVCLDKKKQRALCFSLGDSLIYKLSEKGCVLLNQPDVYEDNRCCATTTIGAVDKVKVNVVDVTNINGMMICSDGAWKLFYNQNTFNDDLWEYSKKQNYYEFKKYIDRSKNMDDSTFIIMDFLSYKKLL